jgi:DNA repair exonuclease SbcCD nuclease subunit
MRFLVFSDLHIHAHSDFDQQIDHTSSRLLDCLNVLDKVKEYYDKYKCDAVLFCGDMFHVPRAVETSTYEPGYRRLENLTDNVKDFIAIAGNHDKADVSKGGPSYSSVYPVSRLRNSIVIVKETESIKLNKTTIHCLPYTKDDQEFTDSLKRVRSNIDKNSHNIVLTHCALNEAENGPNEIRLRNAWSAKTLRCAGDYLFCGHHHHPQRLNSRSIVVGSPIQHNMLDRGDRRGLVIYDTESGKLKRIWLKSSRFHLFEITDRNHLSWFLDQEWEHGISNGYVRFIFRFIPPKDTISRIEDQLVSMGVRGHEIKIQRAPLNSLRNESLTLELSKSNDFCSSIPTYVDHIKNTSLNRKRLIRIGEKLLLEGT